MKPNTSPETFAELVTLLQRGFRTKVVTIVGDVWRNGRKVAIEAITPLFLADYVRDAFHPEMTEAEDGWLRMFIRPASSFDGQSSHFLLWHLPPDDQSYLTMVVASPQTRVWDETARHWREIRDETSPDYVPHWSRLITNGAPTCRLIYHGPFEIVFPRRAFYGGIVTGVEYMERIGWSAHASDVITQQATALARLYKPDADPIVVGLGFHALYRLQGYSRHGPNGYYPYTETDHHWQVVWPYTPCPTRRYSRRQAGAQRSWSPEIRVLPSGK